MLWYAFCYSINIIHILKVVLYLPILNYVLSFNIVILNGIPFDDIGKFEICQRTSFKMKEVSIEQEIDIWLVQKWRPTMASQTKCVLKC